MAEALRDKAQIDPITTSADRIFQDLLQNPERRPSGRLCSRNAMIWARQVEQICSSVMSSDRLLRAVFSGVRSALSDALLDGKETKTVLRLCMRYNPEIKLNSYIVLAVDVVAFRPMITAQEESNSRSESHE
jgi:hypothetical protein